MALYRVETSRTEFATFYVMADSISEAEEDAYVLADGLPENLWTMEDDEVDVVQMRGGVGVDNRALVWTGGPDGDWVRGYEVQDGTLT